jgi:hypothetical protein
LHEELATVVTHVHWQARRDILEVPFGVGWIEVRIIQNVDFLEAHCLQHKLIDLNWFVVFGSLVIQQIQQPQSEGIVMLLSLLGEGHDLLLILIPLGNLLLTLGWPFLLLL